jgi:predicted amidohydrolase YtcJ
MKMDFRNRVLYVLAIIAVSAASAFAQQRATVPVSIIAYPELIIHNAKVVTMDNIQMNTELGTIVQAVAIRDRKIQAVGSNDEILAMAGPNTQKVDVKGRTVIPGIVDSHTHIHNNEVAYWVENHPKELATMARNFSIGGETNADIKKGIELVLKERMSDAEPGIWGVLSLPTNDPKNPGSGTGQGVKFVQKREMTAKDLDKLAPNNPILLQAHPAYMMNEAGKKYMEKLYGFYPPMDVADDTGFGELTEYSRALMVDGYFKSHPDDLTNVVETGLLKNAAVGITSFASHMMGLQFLNAYQKLVREDRMPIRFAYTHYFGFQNNPDPAAFYTRLGDMAGLGNDYFWSAGVGMGNVDSGPPMFCSTMEGPPELKEREWCRNTPGNAYWKGMVAAILSRSRVALGHSYGDKSVDYFMDALEDAQKTDPTITLDYIRSRRFSSDHCGFYPRPDQIPRIAKLGMYISCGGNVLSRSYPWLEMYGTKYANWISPVKSLLKAGVKTTFENEAGVDGLKSETYFKEAYPLITRKNEYGAMVAPEEAVDRITLMKMMTSWPAEFMLREKHIGTIQAGKLADLLVLNSDYFTVPEEKIPTVYPVMTIVGGKILVVRNEAARDLGLQAKGPQIEFKFSGGRYAAQ